MQFPLGIFSIALATAVLPALSKQSAAGDAEGFKSTLQQASSIQLLITIPAMVGLMAMSRPLVELLFERGGFGPESSGETAKALWAYAIGLPFLSGVSIFARAFFSRSNTKTPAVVAAVCLALGLLAALALMGPMRHVGLALASSFTSAVNFFWLAALLKKREGLALKPLAWEAAKYLLWALIMAAALRPLYNEPIADNLGRLWRILAGLAAGPGIYLGLALLFRCPHLAPLRSVAKKLRGKPG
jgi:putative peptidoglycan lipid II flippase